MDPRRETANREQWSGDLNDVEEAFVSPGGHPNWDEVKKFLQAPIRGEAQFGRCLDELAESIRSDREQDFWRIALITLRMVRRQANPMGSEEFGT